MVGAKIRTEMDDDLVPSKPLPLAQVAPAAMVAAAAALPVFWRAAPHSGTAAVIATAGYLAMDLWILRRHTQRLIPSVVAGSAACGCAGLLYWILALPDRTPLDCVFIAATGGAALAVAQFLAIRHRLTTAWNDTELERVALEAGSAELDAHRAAPDVGYLP